MTDAAHTIRDAVAQVFLLREGVKSDPSLLRATLAVKRLQAKRFAGTYADLMASPVYAAPTRFFLEELYSDRDYSKRDSQFARIAGALQRFFPKQVVATAVDLARLHVLSEELDHDMAVQWMQIEKLSAASDGSKYIASWTKIGRDSDRRAQLKMVLKIGEDLERLTRVRGLRTLLRMMRNPAERAGLGSLQTFLELGFDTFAQMSGPNTHTKQFLETIETRETRWIDQLSHGPYDQCLLALNTCFQEMP